MDIHDEGFTLQSWHVHKGLVILSLSFPQCFDFTVGTFICDRLLDVHMHNRFHNHEKIHAFYPMHCIQPFIRMTYFNVTLCDTVFDL